jgi:hypothetical protein
MRAVSCWLPTFALFWLVPAAQAQTPLPAARDFCSEPFTINAVPLTSPGFPLDFEFDQVGYRIFLSKHDKLFIQHLDPATGFFVGNFQQIDSGITYRWPALGVRLIVNGGEWSYSGRGSELYYMKPNGEAGNDRILYKANELSPDVWAASALPQGTTKGFPWPSKDVGDVAPKVLYFRPATGVQNKFPYDAAVRSVPEDPASEQVIPAAVTLEQGGPRWVAGTDQVVLSFLDANSVEQAALYHMDSHVVEPITSYTPQDGVSMDETWSSPYPELGAGERVVWFVVNGTELRVFRQEDGSWIEVNRINPSQVLGKPEKPYMVSPEPFTYGGKPYIVFQLNSGFLSSQNKAADMYIMQPQATSACHFRLISPGSTVSWKKPEALALQDRLVIYFLRFEGGFYTLYQAESGL